MRKVINITLFILVASCSSIHHQLDAVDYIVFMQDPDNGFARTIVSGDVEYEIQFATPEYMTIKGLEELTRNPERTFFNERLKEKSGHIYFFVRIKEKDGGRVAENLVKKADAEQMVMYYHNQAAADFTFKSGDMVRSPVTYLFENNYALVPYNTLIVGFECNEFNKDMVFMFNDRYHNTPYIKTTFSTKELAGLPRLIIK